MFIKIIKNKKILIYVVTILSFVVFLVLTLGNKKTKIPQTEYIINEGGDRNKQEDEVFLTPDKTQDTLQGTEKISDDLEFAKHMRNLYREYPWLSRLPIERDSYALIWVIQEKAFRIIMRISEDSPEEEKKKIINQALKDIDEITGVSHENYPYYVVY